MAPVTASPGKEIPGLRKRKWSPPRDDSEDESCTGRSLTENHEGSATPGTLPGSDTETYNKRARISDTTSLLQAAETTGKHPQGLRKRPELPLEIWQRICSFLEPVCLGRLICVDRSLTTLLDPQRPIPGHLVLQNATQNDVWASSRKQFHPGLPRPLSWTSELEVWRLILGTSCQFCGKKSSPAAPKIPSPWTSGPGLNGVRIIWPFAIRSCGNCLASRMTKDADLRFSDASILLPGLPYAYLTPDLDFITSIALRASSPPIGLDLTRYYFQPQVDHLKLDMDKATTLGQGAAEEWAKGLESIGREKMEVTKRFEHWEATGGLQALRQPYIKHELPAKPAHPALSLPSVPSHVQSSANSAGSLTQSPLSGQHRPSPPVLGLSSGFSTPHLPLKPTSPGPVQPPPGHPPSIISLGQPHGQRSRQERNLGDVNQRKFERRAEIERRCLQLDPPIKLSTLPYMDAFSNAMQIPMALNDNAWEVLKPRLLAQRDDASNREQAFVATNKHLQTQAEERHEQEEQLKQARTLLERQRDEAQRPVREKLATYADELMQNEWDSGAFVTKENAPQFAADMLIYVRRKFLESLGQSDEVREAAALHASLPQGNPDQHLTLEDMKWIYEAKVKPITQRYGKDIFLCGACDVDRKHYALDAVIQHYAAKHTDAFSHGSATVYWKADWPAEPPFDSKPIRSPQNQHVDHDVVPQIYRTEHSRQQQPNVPFVNLEHVYPVRSGFAMTPEMAPHPLMRYAASAYSVDDETGPPRTWLVPVLSGNSQHGFYADEDPYDNHYVPLGHASPSMSHRPTLPPTYGGHAALELHQPRPYRYEESVMVPNGMNGHRSVPPAFQSPKHRRQATLQPGQPSGLQQTQVAELVRNARELWDDTDGIHDLQNSVRVHVIIHHVVHRFSERFTNEPTLTLFMDALTNASQMKPLASLDQLICKSCASHNERLSGAGDQPYALPELLRHFQIAHVDNMAPASLAPTGLNITRPDWKFDMVQLPDERAISNLLHAEGMTDAKLNLIATILWRYFPQPLPTLNKSTLAIPVNDLKYRPGVLDEHAPRNGQNELPADMPPHSATRAAQDNREAEELGRADEYDPHRPAPPYPGPVHRYSFQSAQTISDFQRAQNMGDFAYMPTSHHRRSEVEDIVPPPYVLHTLENPRHMYGDDFCARPWTPPRSERRDYRLDRRRSPHLLYAPPQDHLYRPSRDSARDYDTERFSERAPSSVQQVKQEALETVSHGSANATEQFLKNYDIVHNERVRPDSPIPGSPSDRASDHVSSNRLRLESRGARHVRDRPDIDERPRSGVSSLKGTPRKPLSTKGTSGHSRSPSTVPRMPVTDPAYRVRAEDDDPYDHRREQRPAVQDRYAAPGPMTQPLYDDEIIPQYYEPVSRYRARSTGPAPGTRNYQYPQDLPLRVDYNAGEVIYDPQQREYVQVLPRKTPEYISRRVVREDRPYYVESGHGYVPVDEQSGQPVYAAPLPRRDVRYEPYGNRRNYQ